MYGLQPMHVWKAACEELCGWRVGWQAGILSELNQVCFRVLCLIV